MSAYASYSAHHGAAGNGAGPTHLGHTGAGRLLMDKARLLTLAEQVGGMGHWAWDIASGGVAISGEAAAIFGAAPATLTDLLALIHPDDRVQVQRHFDQAVREVRGFECEVRLDPNANGGLRTLILKGQPERDGTNRPIAVYGVVSDVTEAFAAVRSLHDRTAMLDLAAAMAQLGHAVWSRGDGALPYCSDEMARLHGLTPDDFAARYRTPVQRAVMVAAGDRARYRETVVCGFEQGSPYDITYAMTGMDAVTRDIREIGRPVLEDGAYARFLITVQDVTEQVRVTRELAELNRQKDRLFSIIAHDLRNPFNSVLGYADLLAAKARELSPGKVATYAHMVRESAGAVHSLIENLLAWGAYQIRDGAFKCEAFDLGVATAEGLAPLTHMAEAKGVTIANSVGALRGHGDEALIRVVVRNLVSNAIKFSAPGGVVRITAQMHTPAGDPPMVRVTVRDDGVGIPASAAGALFELDNAVSSPGTRGEKGTGLGLYLCRDIVSRHGGVISVDSASGAGAAFWFTLPAAGYAHSLSFRGQDRLAAASFLGGRSRRQWTLVARPRPRNRGRRPHRLLHRRG